MVYKIYSVIPQNEVFRSTKKRCWYCTRVVYFDNYHYFFGTKTPAAHDRPWAPNMEVPEPEPHANHCPALHDRTPEKDEKYRKLRLKWKIIYESRNEFHKFEEYLPYDKEKMEQKVTNADNILKLDTYVPPEEIEAKEEKDNSNSTMEEILNQIGLVLRPYFAQLDRDKCQ